MTVASRSFVIAELDPAIYPSNHDKDNRASVAHRQGEGYDGNFQTNKSYNDWRDA
jgi:hypothetical protein